MWVKWIPSNRQENSFSIHYKPSVGIATAATTTTKIGNRTRETPYHRSNRKHEFRCPWVLWPYTNRCVNTNNNCETGRFVTTCNIEIYMPFIPMHIIIFLYPVWHFWTFPFPLICLVMGDGCINCWVYMAHMLDWQLKQTKSNTRENFIKKGTQYVICLIKHSLYRWLTGWSQGR